MTTACGVTPQAQKTGISPGLIGTGVAEIGAAEMSRMPIAAGSPRWIGVPWARGEARQICVARIAWPASSAASTPPSAHERCRPAGTRCWCGTSARCISPRCAGLGRSLARERSRTCTNSRSGMRPNRSAKLSANRSARPKARHADRSDSEANRCVHRPPAAHRRGSGSPASVTSKSGHGFGLRWQNSRKSNACSFGNTTRFACT